MRLPGLKVIFLLLALSLLSPIHAQSAQRPSQEALEHYTKGLRYLDDGFLEAAEAELEEAVRLDPEYLDALSALALVYLKRGKEAHYRAVLERAVEVKSRRTGPLELPKPPLAPPEPPEEPAMLPEPKEAREPSEPELWRHQGPEPKEVFILERRARRGLSGELRIEGKIKNNTSRTVQRVEVGLEAFDSRGKPIHPPFTYRGPWELLPGQQAPFSIVVADRGEPVERFDLKPSWQEARD
jgi:tetratricopeptide (TPR) repeat protein